MEPVDPEPRLRRSLVRAPTSQAPASPLSPVIGAAVRQGAAPWYRREWRNWPVGWQAASLSSGLVVIGLMLGLGPADLLSTSAVDVAPGAVSAVASQVEPTLAALQILWRVVAEPYVPLAAAVVIVMVAVSVALVVLLVYVVSGRTWQR